MMNAQQSFSPSPLLASIISVARRAGELVLHMRYSPELEINQKGARNFVTNADIAADQFIKEELARVLPGARFLSEELSPEERDIAGDLWIVDPIDGTTNYTYAAPQVGVSIALSRNGTVIAGVVFCPFTTETFAAEQGVGSWLAAPGHTGWQKLAIRHPKDLEDCLIATGLPYRRTPEVLNRIIPRLSRIIAACKDIRRLGACSVDLCWVACGRIDAYWENVNPWDMAAGGLIAREAGAIVKNLTFSDDPCSANADLPPDINGRNLLAVSPQLEKVLEQLLVG